MSTQPAASPEPEIIYCAAHPSVATVLRCGRCDRPICVRCMIHTPGGIRCPDCARMRRPVLYEVHPLDLAKAAGTALAMACGLGFAGAILLRPGGGIPLFGLMIAVLAGIGAGSVMAAALSGVTRGKRGLPMQGIAAAGLVVAWLLRLALAGALPFILGDLIGGITVAIAVAAAWQRLG